MLTGVLTWEKQVFPPLVPIGKKFTALRGETIDNRTNRPNMKKELIILCAVAALAGCSPQGGTGRGVDESTTITNRGTNVPGGDTNRFGTGQGGTREGTQGGQQGQGGTQGGGNSGRIQVAGIP